MKGWIVAFVICALTEVTMAGLWQIRDQHIGFSTPPCVSFIVSCP